MAINIDTSTTRNLRTLDDWKEYFRTKIPELNPNWTNTSDEDLGMVLVTMISAIGDQLNFRYDTSILEAFLGTARERSNVQAILNLIGYTLKTYYTSRVEVFIGYSDDSGAPFDSDYVIPKFSKLIKSSNPNLTYYNLDEAIIPAGALGVYVTFYEGTYVSDVKSSSDVDKYGRIYLTPTTNNIGSNAVKVTYNETDVLERVEDIYLSSTSKQFELLVDNYGNYYIQLDPSWKDYIEQGSLSPARIEIEYLATSGLTGQVPSNYFDSLLTTTSSPGTLLILNREPASGYLDPETIENARVEAPKYARTMGTAVTIEDYQDLIVTSSDEFIDAIAIDLNYNGAQGNFVSLNECKMISLQNASSNFIPTLCVDYVFSVMEEIDMMDEPGYLTEEQLTEKYFDTGVLGSWTVLEINTKIKNYEYLDVLSHLFDEIINMTSTLPPTPITTWQTGKTYKAKNVGAGIIGDTVIYQGKIYECLIEHSSTSFSSNLASGYWTELENENLYTAIYKLFGDELVVLFNDINQINLLELFDAIQQETAEKNILNLEPYELYISVLTSNYILTESQKDLIREILDEVKLATIQYTLQPPQIKEVDIYLTVAVSSSVTNNTNVISTIKELVKQYFDSLMIGEGFKLSKLLTYIHNNYPLSGLLYILPSTSITPGTTVALEDCEPFEIVRNNLTQASDLIVEVNNI